MKELTYEVNSNGCWIVTSHAKNSEGYHKVVRNKRQTYAHRLMYEKEFGKIDDNLVIRHKCDNRSCCNPYHLEVGTHKDNVNDRVNRNRSAIGESHGRSKLTEEQAIFIKYNNKLKNSELAKMFEVDPKVIRNIKNGIQWKHI